MQKKDKRCIGLIYDHYADSLYGVLMQMLKDEALAQDALQESFIKIWQKGDTYDPNKSKLFTWLLRIVRNTAIDKIRSKKTRSNKEIQIDDSNVYQMGKENIRPEHLDLNQHIATLEPKYQEIIRVLFFEGMTQQEASEHLDIPLGTVKTRLKIALRELRKIFNEPMFITILFIIILS